MKKIYTLMAAAATTLSMMAAPADVHPVLNDVNREAQKLEAQLSQLTVVNGTRETTGKKKLPAQPDLNSFYGSFFVSAAQTDNGFRTGALKFEKKSDTEVIIYGFGMDYPVVGQYNPSTQILTVKSGQVLCPAELWGGEDLILKLCVSGGPDGLTETSQVQWQYDPEGTMAVSNSSTGESFEIYDGLWRLISDDDKYTYFVTTMESIFPSAYSFRYFYTPFSLDEEFPNAGNFTFNESEWKSVGESDFVDGWFANPLLNDGAATEAYKVQTYRNIQNPSVYLLSKPYNVNSIMYAAEGQDTPNAEGYIYIDATDPECVLVRPHIASGLTSEYLFDCSTPVTLTTADGISYYIDDVDIDEIKDEADMWGDELSTMDENGLITLVRCRFQTVSDFYTENYWIESRDNPIPVEMRSTIQLPAAALGINNIITDTDNATVRYFNLQGVEIANPEAGQVVIVKEGKNSKKVIL